MFHLYKLAQKTAGYWESKNTTLACKFDYCWPIFKI